MEVAGEVGTVGDETAAPAVRPDLILVDVAATLPDSPEAVISRLGARFPGVPVLAIGEREQTPMALRLLSVGARGFICRDVPPEVLVQALYLVAHGYVLLPQTQLPPVPGGQRAPVNAVPSFTPREQEILRLLVRGYSNREIAAQLVVSESTVKTHVHHMLQKVNVHNRAELVAWALQHQVV